MMERVRPTLANGDRYMAETEPASQRVNAPFEFQRLMEECGAHLSAAVGLKTDYDAAVADEADAAEAKAKIPDGPELDGADPLKESEEAKAARRFVPAGPMELLARGGFKLLAAPFKLGYALQKMDATARAEDSKRMQVMQAKTAYERIGKLYEQVDALDAKAREYNAKVRKADPELFRQIAKIAAASPDGATEEAVLSRVMDVNDKDPALRGPRQRMAKLATSPAFSADRVEIAKLVSGVERDSRYVGKKLAAMPGANPEAIEKVGAAIAATVGKRVDAIPALAVEKPNAQPGKMKERLGQSMSGLQENIAEAMRKMVEALSSMVRRR